MRATLVLSLLATTAAAAPHPFGFDDLIRARRLGGFDLSPDGRRVAYSVGTQDPDTNTKRSAVWIGTVDGRHERQITAGTKHDGDPRFAPDGERLAFVSDRDGAPQIWLLDLEGGEPRKLSDLPGGADGVQWSPDGKFLVTTSQAYPDCPAIPEGLACNRARFGRADKHEGSSGRVVERLLFRHWDAWADGRRSHLFRVDAQSGEARDLTPGDFDAPVFSLGGMTGFDISPDGKSIVFSSNHDPKGAEAWSTNADLFEVSSTGGPARRLTDNPAWDGTPRYSPDGKSIAYRAQKVPGYESDKFELRIYDRKTRASRSLTASFDDWVEDYAWSRDGGRLFFTSTVRTKSPIFTVDLEGHVAPRLEGLSASDVTVAKDGAVVFVRVSLRRPAELWRLEGSASIPQPVTHLNDDLFAAVEMGEVREREVITADGKREQSLVVLPPRFDARKKYPALFWVHGGPQGAWDDGWSYRWNPEVLASAGYVVYMPNPRGSTGYGQEWVRGVSGDWGGKVFDDLMRAADDLESLPYVKKGKVGAAGASFGGFMINWFQGHTDRFAALFCHDGIADQQAMYATEELWFPEHEFGGLPWESSAYRNASPIESASRFKTPELIVHGERDYRIPVPQALLMFTVLQRKGIPSKLLVFPDENHWVLKPANARLWYATMIDWFHRFLGGAPADPKALQTAASETR